MDFNKDGYVDRADFKARMEQRRGECFDKADINHDGKLSRVEFSNMREVCPPRHDRKGMHAGKRQGAEAPARYAQEALRGRPALQGAGFFAPGRKSSRLKPLPPALGGNCAGRGYAPDADTPDHELEGPA